MKKLKFSLLLACAGIFCFLMSNNLEFQHDIQDSKKKSKIKPIKKSITVGETQYDGPEKYAYYHSAVRAGQADLSVPLKYPQYGPNYKVKELINAKNNKFNQKSARASNATFTERGPSNVPGRTRAILIDPDDPTQATWFAGNVSGGIWKTTNSGESWTEIAPDLDNLAIVTLAMSEANTNVIYAGTGEGFVFGGTFILNGDGIYKTTDKGVTWNVLASTLNSEFQNVSRIIVDPTDENIVLASTSGYKAIGGGAEAFGAVMRSTDGGASWTKVFETDAPVQQIIAAPSDFNKQYCTVADGGAVYRSDDAGLTWNKKSTGMNRTGRVELGISYTDPAKVFASAEGDASGTGTDLYVTENGGESWGLVETLFEGTQISLLNEQGWYDNAVLVNPFNDDKVYVAGVGMYLVEVDTDNITTGSAYNVDTDETEFLGLVDFSASAAGGTLEVGANANETTVEVRFGAGKSQKAHRFLVPEGQGSGVPDANYSYTDYVDVPFEVWDVDNNRQLMVSFRDQQRNGTFELINRNTDGDPSTHSREYIYINDVDYDPDNANTDIAVNGGHVFNQMYFFWPFLVNGENWTPELFDDSNATIAFESFEVYPSELTTVSDGRGEYDGKNTFEFVFLSLGEVVGVHVDHHWMVPLITDESNQEFSILNGNDGGIYITKPAVDPGTVEGDWIWSSSGYNTMQFYGADKVAGEDRYWGGAQDNGTWMTPEGATASSTSPYQFVIGGDGFEAVTHYTIPGKMIGGSQFNGFFGTDDNWQTFYNAQNGLGGNGPFVSRLSAAYQDPDVIFTVESTGVYKSVDFGRSWKEIPITDGWGFWSGIDVEVSKADPRIVWAGGRMTNTGNIFVSTDGGESFEAVPNFDNIGLSTGLYSHPTQDSTAFVVFSVANSPKILKTTDLGETWEDISGFSTGSTSVGFPDVAVFAVQAMPYDEDVIWAGTEIGLFETVDGGATWAIVDEFPSVTIWDLSIRDGQVVIATHGRGVWSAEIPELTDFVAPTISLIPELLGVVRSEEEIALIASMNFRSIYDSTQIRVNNQRVVSVSSNSEVGENTIVFTVEDGQYDIQGVSYNQGTPLFSQTINVIFESDSDGDGFDYLNDCDDTNPDINPEAEDIPDNDIDEDCDGVLIITSILDEKDASVNIYPVPSSERITIAINSNFSGHVKVQLIDINGRSKKETVIENFTNQEISFDVSNLPLGVYFIKISDRSSSLTRRISIQ
ncbi:MAG: T9SS type A sorting domain-containing protein [Fulvivirga sp.]|uniref:VPS10 domain-containing protein n=1 Tax=Fulvivirga sp. TaxID=1931237 RepID=UPI0032EAA9B2